MAGYDFTFAVAPALQAEASLWLRLLNSDTIWIVQVYGFRHEVIAGPVLMPGPERGVEVDVPAPVIPVDDFHRPWIAIRAEVVSPASLTRQR